VDIASGNPNPVILGPVNHVAAAVTDLHRSEQWYRHALGLVRIDGDIDEDGTGHVILSNSSGGWLLTLTSASALTGLLLLPRSSSYDRRSPRSTSRSATVPRSPRA
jgi:catechol 2,3-dioxygenase-like lactoylglutathione lyase family enzyme